MNTPLILRTLGIVLLCEAGALVPSLIISFSLGEEDYMAFITSIFIITIFAVLLVWRPVDTRDVGYKEGFVIATLSWILLAVFGAVPYMLSGAVPSFVNAFFETMSGFTTTGATIIEDVESLTHGILFWRSLTQWMGGMGVIVLTLALIPSLKIAGMKLFKAEVPGPTKDKVVPGIIKTARQLYKVYLLISFLELISLKIAGLSWFDSFIHTFTTVSTGGFSNQNTSIGSYNAPAVEYIIIFFMFIGGINFALHYHLLKRNAQPVLQDRELKLYIIIAVSAILLVGINLKQSMNFDNIMSFRHSAFQVISIMTSTGYSTADFNQWPAISKSILVALMFIGGCAGSTAGGMKQARFYILSKTVSRQTIKLIHPRAVVPVRVGDHVVNENIVENVQAYFFIFLGLQATTTIALSAMGMDLISAFSASIASLGNIGPGLGMVGPISTFTSIPAAGKILLSICMLLGRLEIYTVLVVFTVKFWR
ncbi:MAG: TrkH family potassium uptake protein [Clostridiales bacterium]|nr:TrkH family potassium uptake protein [Clostridiales bacterium]MCF8021343.1 TrkH family potassium uptake protein [Clostridiales bacterium]